MAQDPRSLHMFINDVVNYSAFTEKASPVMGNPKRYATYFPSKASFEAKQRLDASDNDSTWEYSAPVAPPSRSSSSTTTSCDTANSTPAQEIVIRYRAGSPSSPSETRSSSPSQYSEEDEDSWDIVPAAELFDSEYVAVAPEQDIKARYRQSRHDALLNTYQEAIDVVRASGLRPNDKVVCHRPGCRDTLANVKALMYHLHIHDIHDRYVVCPHCKGSFEGQRELRIHNCRRRSKPSHVSPIRDTFRRVLTKLSF